MAGDVSGAQRGFGNLIGARVISCLDHHHHGDNNGDGDHVHDDGDGDHDDDQTI